MKLSILTCCWGCDLVVLCSWQTLTNATHCSSAGHAPWHDDDSKLVHIKQKYHAGSIMCCNMCCVRARPRARARLYVSFVVYVLWCLSSSLLFVCQGYVMFMVLLCVVDMKLLICSTVLLLTATKRQLICCRSLFLLFLLIFMMIFWLYVWSKCLTTSFAVCNPCPSASVWDSMKMASLLAGPLGQALRSRSISDLRVSKATSPCFQTRYTNYTYHTRNRPQWRTTHSTQHTTHNVVRAGNS